jgi:hypothetical protein
MKLDQPQAMNRNLPDKPLTALERELLNCVERLVSASEASAEQFNTLEKRSTGSIVARQNEFDHCVRSLMASQALLIEALSAFANVSPGSESAQKALHASATVLVQASQAMKQMAK